MAEAAAEIAKGVALQDPTLLCRQGYVDGRWIDADSGATFPVTNPADGSVLAAVPDMGEAETRRAIEAAERAYPAWRAKTAKERAAILRAWHDLIMANREDLALLMTAEQGKPLAESRGEMLYAASFVEWFAEEAKRCYGDVIPQPSGDRRIVVTKEPVGVVGAITPWNFPSAMITRKAAPAIAVGCTVVIKPAEQTPLSALALGVLADRAGMPPGVLNLITSNDPPCVGRELTANPKVRKISFTGSTEVGKLLLGQSASTVKKVSLELGGNAPFIVFDDADLDAALKGAVTCKYRNTGQTCISANRFLIQDGIYDAFAERLANEAGKLRIGNGLSKETDQGPLIDEPTLAKVEDHVADAVGKGAKLMLGGARHELGGTFFQPTVIANVNTQMKVAREETFGPVAPLFRFSTEDEVIKLANDTEYGLAAYFYSRDIGRVWRVAEALEFGIVGINVGFISTEVAPFGGMKESGIGREGSGYGLDEYVEVKYLCMGDIDR